MHSAKYLNSDWTTNNTMSSPLSCYGKTTREQLRTAKSKQKCQTVVLLFFIKKAVQTLKRKAKKKKEEEEEEEEKKETIYSHKRPRECVVSILRYAHALSWKKTHDPLEQLGINILVMF